MLLGFAIGHPGQRRVPLLVCKQSQLGAQFTLSVSINLYMFRATMCPSSGETTVFMRHLVLVILYGRLSGMQGGMKLIFSPIMAANV